MDKNLISSNEHLLKFLPETHFRSVLISNLSELLVAKKVYDIVENGDGVTAYQVSQLAKISIDLAIECLQLLQSCQFIKLQDSESLKFIKN